MSYKRIHGEYTMIHQGTCMICGGRFPESSINAYCFFTRGYRLPCNILYCSDPKCKDSALFSMVHVYLDSHTLVDENLEKIDILDEYKERVTILRSDGSFNVGVIKDHYIIYFNEKFYYSVWFMCNEEKLEKLVLLEDLVKYNHDLKYRLTNRFTTHKFVPKEIGDELRSLIRDIKNTYSK